MNFEECLCGGECLFRPEKRVIQFWRAAMVTMIKCAYEE